METAGDVGQSLPHEFLVGVQPLAGAAGDASSNRQHLNQPNSSDGQRSGGQSADQLEI